MLFTELIYFFIYMQHVSNISPFINCCFAIHWAILFIIGRIWSKRGRLAGSLFQQIETSFVICDDMPGGTDGLKPSNATCDKSRCRVIVRMLSNNIELFWIVPGKEWLSLFSPGSSYKNLYSANYLMRWIKILVIFFFAFLPLWSRVAFLDN